MATVVGGRTLNMGLHFSQLVHFNWPAHIKAVKRWSKPWLPKRFRTLSKAWYVVTVWYTALLVHTPVRALGCIKATVC